MSYLIRKGGKSSLIYFQALRLLSYVIIYIRLLLPTTHMSARIASSNKQTQLTKILKQQYKHRIRDLEFEIVNPRPSLTNKNQHGDTFYHLSYCVHVLFTTYSFPLRQVLAQTTY